MGLSCLPRPSYGNRHGWTHSFAVPSVKVSRSCVSSVCDHLRVLPKLFPAVSADVDFQTCDRMWWWGFARCLQIKSEDEFYPFREDFMGTLMPDYKARFGERYTTTEVPIFLQS